MYLNSLMGLRRCYSTGIPDSLVRIRNRNPMNLDKMRLGYKPRGFDLNEGNLTYWNRLTLDAKDRNNHTTATVTHWTGRHVCRASTTEWALRKHLYNYRDVIALKLVGQVLGERCLETGILEVNVDLSEEELKRDKIALFLESLKSTGLIIHESQEYEQFNPFRQLGRVTSNPKSTFKPWEIIDE